MLLKGVKLFVFAGNGCLGLFEFDCFNVDLMEIEVGAEMCAFVHCVKVFGVFVCVDFYGDGIYDWLYW